MAPETRYLRWFVTGILGVMALTAGLSWFVDPFSIFNPPDVPGINTNKPDYVEHLRLTHVYRVEHLKPDCILLGTSRAGRGFSSDHPALKGLHCYNLSLPAISMYEMRRYLQHAQANRPQKLVVLALDFRVFNSAPDESGAFSEERLAVDSAGRRQFNFFTSRLPDMTSSLISLPALQASLRSIRKQKWVKDTLAPDGYWMPLTDRYDHLTAFRAYTQNSARRFVAIKQHEDIFRSNSEELRFLLRAAYSGKTEAKLLIPPSHAWHWQTLQLSGLWPRFESMKRLLVKINAEEAKRAGREPYPVWDFSGSYGPTLEPLPYKPDHTMHWFWDPVHFKRSFGDVLLSRVMSEEASPVSEHANLGIRLTESNLEIHLEQLRLLQEGYAAKHQNEVTRIKDLVDSIYQE